jgi:hypothetical protein
MISLKIFFVLTLATPAFLSATAETAASPTSAPISPGAASVERRIEYAKNFPEWVDLRGAYTRQSGNTGYRGYPPTCESSSKCEAVFADFKMERIPFSGSGSVKVDIVQVYVEVKAVVKTDSINTDTYHGFYVKFPNSGYHLLDESFGPDGCGEPNFVKAKGIYARSNLVILETLWDGFHCASAPLYRLLARVVIAEQNKMSAKVSVSRFEYNKKVKGFYTWENEDAGVLGYYETARPEIVTDSSCDSEKYSSCKTLEVARKIEWPFEKRSDKRRIQAASLKQSKTGEWQASVTNPWSSPAHEFIERNNLIQPKAIVDGPANLFESRKGKIKISIPNNEEVRIFNCKSNDRWVHVGWKEHNAFILAKHIPKFNLEKECYIFDSRD